MTPYVRFVARRRCTRVVCLFIACMLLLAAGCTEGERSPRVQTVLLRLTAARYATPGASSTRGDTGSDDTSVDADDCLALLFDGEGVLLSCRRAQAGDVDGTVQVTFDGKLSNPEWLVLLANFYAVRLDASQFRPGATRLTDLARLEFEMPEGVLPDRLPMKGTLKLTDEPTGAVVMARCVAKLEVQSGLPEGWQLLEAEFGGHKFVRRNADGNLCLYVCPRDLPPEPGHEERRLTVTVSDPAGNVSTAIIQVAPYENGLPRTSRDDEEEWKALLPNTHYLFRLTHDEPQIEIQDLVYIYWYSPIRRTPNGEYLTSDKDCKFGTYRIQVLDRVTGEKYYAIEDLSPFKTVDADEGIYLYRYEVERKWIPASLPSNWIYRLYSCATSGHYSEGPVLEDAVKIENIDNHTDIWLNREPIACDWNLNYYPTDCPYRIYTRSEATQIWVKASSGYTPYKDSWDPTLKVYVYPESCKVKTDGRGYGFLEFEMEPSVSLWKNYRFEYLIMVSDEAGIAKYNLNTSNATHHPLTEFFTCKSIFRQTVDGKDYYVFYYN